MHDFYLCVVIIICILLIFIIPQYILPITAIGAALVIYDYGEFNQKYGGAGCTTQDFNKTMDQALDGYKTEAKVRHMFDCFVKNGSFEEISLATGKSLKWLFKDDKVTGNKIYLDFDGYNSAAKVAFEYNGLGHYRNIYGGANDPKSYHKFLLRSMNDQHKRILAIQNKVVLIIIHCDVKPFQLENYIKSRLKDENLLKPEFDTPASATFKYIDKIAEPDVEKQFANSASITINPNKGTALKRANSMVNIPSTAPVVNKPPAIPMGRPGFTSAPTSQPPPGFGPTQSHNMSWKKQKT